MQTKVNLSSNSDAFVDIPGEGNSDISGASGEAIDDFYGVANGDISGDDGKVNGATISLVDVDVRTVQFNIILSEPPVVNINMRANTRSR